MWLQGVTVGKKAKICQYKSSISGMDSTKCVCHFQNWIGNIWWMISRHGNCLWHRVMVCVIGKTTHRQRSFITTHVINFTQIKHWHWYDVEILTYYGLSKIIGHLPFTCFHSSLSLCHITLLIFWLFLSVHLCVWNMHINILPHTQTDRHTHTYNSQQHSHITVPCPHTH